MPGTNHRTRRIWRIAASSATSATSCSLTGLFAVAPARAGVAGHLRLPLVALPFWKGRPDGMLGDETADCFDDRTGHRDGRDQIIAGVGQGLALRGVGGYGQDVERGACRIRKPRAQDHPQHWRPPNQILPLVCPLLSVQFHPTLTPIQYCFPPFPTPP